MGKGEQRHPGRGSRRLGRTPLLWVAELLVVVLLAGGAAAYHFDLGERWFGWRPVDPSRNPAQVLPPVGLDLPTAVAAAPVAKALADRGAVDPAKVAAAVAPYVARAKLGPRVSVLVASLRDGQVVYRHGPATVMPASTNKLLTSTAALEVLGGQARFTTAVRLSPDQRRLSLVGGGDPYLASTPQKARGHYPVGADLTTLARQAAAKLRARGVTRVRLAYDTTLFTGPTVNPAWPDDYVPSGVVPPITALWADQGLAPSGYGYVTDPAAAAAADFRAALVRAGVQVAGATTSRRTPAAFTGLTEVKSAPLAEIVQHLLETSDNNAAEVVGHQVGLAVRQRGSFVAGAAAVLTTLRTLGIPTAGDRLYDGSGLSRQDRLAPETLLRVLETDASTAHPELRPVLTGLPVAGFTGSLAVRFDRGPEVARGRVRAKTGTLTGVHGLAGTAVDRDGDELVFVAVADRVAVPNTLAARLIIDQLAGSLAACSCGAGPP